LPDLDFSYYYQNKQGKDKKAQGEEYLPGEKIDLMASGPDFFDGAPDEGEDKGSRRNCQPPAWGPVAGCRGEVIQCHGSRPSGSMEGGVNDRPPLKSANQLSGIFKIYQKDSI